MSHGKTGTKCPVFFVLWIHHNITGSLHHYFITSQHEINATKKWAYPVGSISREIISTQGKQGFIF